MGNTVGSTNADFRNLAQSEKNAYAFGLWCADGYHRTSSIGLSNVDIDLIGAFSSFLTSLFPVERLKMRIYEPDDKLRRTRAYHVYVNSRPLLRRFKAWKSNPSEFITRDLIAPYMAGRFDGDGSVGSDFHRDCRIVYGSQSEAEYDKLFLEQVGFSRSKIYYYQAARTFCLYISRLETGQFLSLIYSYSVRLQKSAFVPRRDLVLLSTRV